MPSYPPRDMSESERRRRAAARARRKRQVARNRLIFCAVCLVLIAAVGFGVFKLVGVSHRREGEQRRLGPEHQPDHQFPRLRFHLFQRTGQRARQ